MIFAINANILAIKQKFQNDISCLIHKIKKNCYATNRKSNNAENFDKNKTNQTTVRQTSILKISIIRDSMLIIFVLKTC